MVFKNANDNTFSNRTTTIVKENNMSEAEMEYSTHLSSDNENTTIISEQLLKDILERAKKDYGKTFKKLSEE